MPGKNALTVKQVKEEYNISRYVLKRWAKEGKIELHRPNCRDLIFMRADIEAAIRKS